MENRTATVPAEMAALLDASFSFLKKKMEEKTDVSQVAGVYDGEIVISLRHVHP